jgi:hypothetical protein
MLWARFELIPSIYLCAGYVLIVGVHELGHLAAARIADHSVSAIEITGAGGRCWTEYPRSFRAAFLIYSGGILAQLLLLLVGVACYLVLRDLRSDAVGYLLIVCGFLNAAILIVNAIPTAGVRKDNATDGDVLWGLLRHYWKQRV